MGASSSIDLHKPYLIAPTSPPQLTFASSWLLSVFYLDNFLHVFQFKFPREDPLFEAIGHRSHRGHRDIVCLDPIPTQTQASCGLEGEVFT